MSMEEILSKLNREGSIIAETYSDRKSTRLNSSHIH